MEPAVTPCDGTASSTGDQAPTHPLTPCLLWFEMARVLAKGVRWLRLDDGAVIFVPDATHFIDLDEVGSQLFDLLAASAFDVEAASDVIQSLDASASASTTREVMRGFLERLDTKGVFVMTTDQPEPTSREPFDSHGSDPAAPCPAPPRRTGQ